MAKLNCWEFENCGKQPKGVKRDCSGVCPAAKEEKFDRINHGRNGGRVCWLVRQKSSDRKDKSAAMATCSQCDFYKLVEKEEESDFFAYP